MVERRFAYVPVLTFLLVQIIFIFYRYLLYSSIC